MSYDAIAEAVEKLHDTNRELTDSVLGEMTKFKVTTLAKLRTYSGNAKQVTVTDSVRGGDFYLDASDATSNDNDGTVIVDQLGRRWKRYFIGSPSVLWFGAIGNGSADDTAAIKKAMAASNYLFWPGREYGISNTVTSTSDQVWSTDGEVKFTAIFGAGTPARPMFDFRGKITAPGNFVVDHRAHILNYSLPQAYFGNPIVGSAVLVQGDWSQIKGWQVINAWDNGIAVVALDPISGKEIAGSPKYGTCTDIKTALCGVGEHGGLTPGKIGAGIDIASASAWSVNDCVDYMSYIGFILDIGAGAQCQFSNCTAFYTKVDTNNPLNGSGYGFYVGSNESSFVNCTSIGAGFRGLWMDGANCEFTNFVVYIPQQEGVFIKNGQNRGTFRIKGAGAKQANTYDAVMIDCSARAITELHLDIATTGSNHRWGVNAVGNNTIDARIVGIVTGTSGKVNRQNYNIGTYFMSAAVGAGKRFGFNKDEPGFEVDILGKSRITAAKANLSSITNLFGDNGDNGSFIVEDFLTPSKRGAQGWDPVNDWYALQAVHVNTAKKDIALNPGGGNVRGGKGTWDSCIVLGNTYIWADTTGALRRKIGAPTSATDGTLFT